uniref:FTH domain-containing protein n=1 Tax=Caenorhabditis tropicalis TaxID=1561998 RepID=A0A1I7V239_9PELO
MYYDGPRKVLLDASFSKLLKLFDPRNLRCISIAPRICPSIMEEVVNSEQWKNATSLQSFGIYEYDTDLEPFLHFNQLNIQHFEHPRAEKAWKFVQNFLTRNPPLESSFKVLSIADLNMDLLFKYFPVPPFNQPTENDE